MKTKGVEHRLPWNCYVCQNHEVERRRQVASHYGTIGKNSTTRASCFYETNI